MGGFAEGVRVSLAAVGSSDVLARSWQGTLEGEREAVDATSGAASRSSRARRTMT